MFEWLGLRPSPADDDGLAIYLLASVALMVVLTAGAQESAARTLWWGLFATSLFAQLVYRARAPERIWVAKAIGGVAAVAFTPLGAALVLGSEPSGPALAALVLVPAAAAGLVVQGSRRDASRPARGR